jgi:hypothetical protein
MPEIRTILLRKWICPNDERRQQEREGFLALYCVSIAVAKPKPNETLKIVTITDNHQHDHDHDHQHDHNKLHQQKG